MLKKIKNIMFKLDEHTLEVLSKSSSSLIVKIVGVLLGFSISVILGRTIGPDGLGIINLANQIVSIVLVISLLGMNNVVLKEISIAFQKKNFQHIADTIFTSLKINIPVAFIFSLIFILLSDVLVNDFFNENRLKFPLVVGLLLMTFQVVSRLFGSSINGFKKIWQSNFFNETLSLLVVFIFLVIFLILNIEITIFNVAIFYGFARIIVAISATLYWRKLFSIKLKRKMLTRQMLSVALPLLIVSASFLIASNADVIMLGLLSNSTEVGFYSVASKLGLFTNFFLSISISVLAPKIASLYNDNKLKELETMIQQTTKGLIIISLFTFLTYFFGGKYILLLWGSEFLESFWILIIISLGQLFNVSTGCTGVFLMMTGHEKLIGKITFISLLINLTLNFIMIPKFGAIGAALATSFTVIFENMIKVIFVKNISGIMTIPFFNKLKFNS